MNRPNSPLLLIYLAILASKTGKPFFLHNPSLCQCPPVKLCPPIPICTPNHPAATLQPNGCIDSSCPYRSDSSPSFPSYSYSLFGGYAPSTQQPQFPSIASATIENPTNYVSYYTSNVNDGTTSEVYETNNVLTTAPPRIRVTSNSVLPQNFPNELFNNNDMPEGDSQPQLRVEDVSANAKDLVPFNIYQKRYHYLRQLKYRILRQYSAPSADKENSSICNDKKLARVMVKAMVNDVSISKKLIRRATEMSFNGKKFDVLCAVGDFTYSIYAEQYCEASRGDVTCFAFI